MRKSFCLSLAGLFTVALLQQSTAFAYELDATNRTISVAPGISATETTNDLRNALSYLVNRKDPANSWTLKLEQGKYYLDKQITIRNLQNVSIFSDMGKPAQLIKDSTWNATTGGEYILNVTFSKNIALRGIQFYGQTDYSASPEPVWPDQGIYFGSCNGVTIQNNGFFNFGNTALRVATNERDPIVGVNSFNTTVSNNLFNNIYQLSTTTTDQLHGGTNNYLLQSNVFYNLRGSIKFASRTPGGQNIKILNNKINGGDHYGIEVCNYNDMEIRGNTLQNLKEYAINIYNNTQAPTSFNWGENITVAENTITSVGRGLRFSTEPYADGVKLFPKNVKFEGNIFNGVSELNTGVPVIAQINGGVAGLTITGNKLSNILNKKYIGYTAASTSVIYLNNQVDGAPYGPQQTTALK